MHLEFRVTCRSEELGALTDDSAMDLVEIGSATDCEV